MVVYRMFRLLWSFREVLTILYNYFGDIINYKQVVNEVLNYDVKGK